MYKSEGNILVQYTGKAKCVTGIPTWIKTIGSMAFYGNLSIEQVNLPEQVSFIKMAAFKGCANLKDIVIPDCEYSAIEMSAFEGCAKLENIILPNSLDRIESCLFKGCSNLKNIQMPNELIYISSGAFENCTSLENISIPATIRHISDDAFKGCKIKNLHLKSTYICEVDNTDLGIRNYKTCNLYVPKGTKDIFTTHPYFSKFQNIMEENITVH